MPQPLPYPAPCVTALGYDYLLFIDAKKTLWCCYQSALYKLAGVKGVVDVATADNVVAGVSEEGWVWIWEFNPVVLGEGEDIRPVKVETKSKASRVWMREGEMWLGGEETIYYMQRNEWYQPSQFSDPQVVRGLTDITKVCPGTRAVYFLNTHGDVYFASKQTPTVPSKLKTNMTFIDIAAGDGGVGVCSKGRLW